MMNTEDEVKSNLASNIKRLRQHRELTQEQLAEKSGVSLQTINNAECCRNFPTLENLVKISNALNVLFPELFTTPGFLPDQREEMIRAHELFQIKEQIDNLVNDTIKKINPNVVYDLNHMKR